VFHRTAKNEKHFILFFAKKNARLLFSVLNSGTREGVGKEIDEACGAKHAGAADGVEQRRLR
jgi:hypothetical protein